MVIGRQLHTDGFMAEMEMRQVSEATLTLGTLGQNTAIFAATRIDAGRLEGTVPRKIKHQMTFSGKAATEGPIIVGLTNMETVAEMAEKIAADPQHHKDDTAIQESLRGMLSMYFIGLQATQSPAADDYGPMRNARWPGWHVHEGKALVAFAFNFGAALTTGTVILLHLEILGDWLHG